MTITTNDKIYTLINYKYQENVDATHILMHDGEENWRCALQGKYMTPTSVCNKLLTEVPIFEEGEIKV